MEIKRIILKDYNTYQDCACCILAWHYKKLKAFEAKMKSPYKEVGMSSVDARGSNASAKRKKDESKRKFKGFAKAIHVRVDDIK